jgi:acyl-CoA synthetase (AMP-forming)/AMP-acid ligase II
LNLTDPILRQARMQPDAAALIEGERIITYGALADLVLRTAGHLIALGVAPGDHVGICLKDNCDHVVTLLAVLRLGAIAIQIDWRSRPVEKVRIANAFALKLMATMPDSDIDAACPRVAVDGAWHQAVAAAHRAAAHAQDPHVPAALLASSGTTGLPKFTLGTHHQLYCHASGYLEIIPPTHRHIHLVTLPLYFSASRLSCLTHLMRGDRVILYGSLYTAAEFVDAANRHRATVSWVSPSLVRQLLPIADPAEPLLPDMDVLISVGAPLFAEEKRQAIGKLTLSEIYGSAAIGVISTLRPSDLAERPASVGRPPALVEVEVVDEAGRPLGPQAPGRLRCRGPALSSPVGSGHGADDFRDGWYYPGEIAALDERGYIYLQGRTSELIFRGGAKVFPAEVEAVLQEHAGVIEAAVLGRPASNNEHDPIAFVTINRPVPPGELMAHCRTRLTAYKVPREIHIVSALPRHSSGKVDKRALQDHQAMAISHPTHVDRQQVSVLNASHR